MTTKTLLFLALLTAAAFSLTFSVHADEKSEQPNVLFIAIDDLNHWVTHLGRNPQAQTPNIDRLAAMGTTFTHAYCAVPACEPSRAAIMGGRRPWTTGCYLNGHIWKDYLPIGDGLSTQFLDSGYYTAGAGKIFHTMAFRPEEWTETFDKAGLSSNGPGVDKYDGYHNDVVHPDLKDEDIVDWHSANYIIERLGKKHDQPFFLACGLYKPHLAFVAPRKYYDAFPLESIGLPPHLENDLDDIPTAGVRMAGPDKDHAKFLRSGRWKAAIQSYLATCAYTDMNVGRLLDALENGPNKDNTIIVLWTDHGWSLGEKQHWRKFALWEEPTRTPYIWVVPGMTQPGTRCDRTVDLMSIYPTLCDLAGIEKPDHLEGHSITKLLKNPRAPWPHPAITTHGRGNHTVRTESHRYIRYANGQEELYNSVKDPYEYRNLAGKDESAAVIKKLAAFLPKEEAPSAEKK
ncbi:MAG: sulfatase [Verrucomicrobiota bacterium]